MKKSLILFIILISIIFCQAKCLENQININTASLKELDEIIWVGPATAEKIYKGRPFEKLDDLINISGIGDKKLADIKEEGLACVEAKEDDEKLENEKIKKDSKTNKTQNNLKEPETKLPLDNPPPQNTTPKIIQLNTKTIKNLDDEDSNKTNKILSITNENYPIYGLVLFCILLSLLFVLKQKRYTKNEFN